jgi:hypothetical protein
MKYYMTLLGMKKKCYSQQRKVCMPQNLFYNNYIDNCTKDQSSINPTNIGLKLDRQNHLFDIEKMKFDIENHILVSYKMMGKNYQLE